MFPLFSVPVFDDLDVRRGLDFWSIVFSMMMDNLMPAGVEMRFGGLSYSLDNDRGLSPSLETSPILCA
jgi:hypothetical protein